MKSKLELNEISAMRFAKLLELQRSAIHAIETDSETKGNVYIFNAVELLLNTAKQYEFIVIDPNAKRKISGTDYIKEKCPKQYNRSKPQQRTVEKWRTTLIEQGEAGEMAVINSILEHAKMRNTVEQTNNSTETDTREQTDAQSGQPQRLHNNSKIQNVLPTLKANETLQTPSEIKEQLALTISQSLTYFEALVYDIVQSVCKPQLDRKQDIVQFTTRDIGKHIYLHGMKANNLQTINTAIENIANTEFKAYAVGKRLYYVNSKLLSFHATEYNEARRRSSHTTQAGETVAHSNNNFLYVLTAKPEALLYANEHNSFFWENLPKHLELLPVNITPPAIALLYEICHQVHLIQHGLLKITQMEKNKNGKAKKMRIAINYVSYNHFLNVYFDGAQPTKKQRESFNRILKQMLTFMVKQGYINAYTIEQGTHGQYKRIFFDTTPPKKLLKS